MLKSIWRPKFCGNQAQRNLKLGYFDAYRVLKFWQVNIMLDWNTRKTAFDYFSNLNPEAIITVAKTLGLERNMPERRLLLKILPKLVEIKMENWWLSGYSLACREVGARGRGGSISNLFFFRFNRCCCENL